MPKADWVETVKFEFATRNMVVVLARLKRYGPTG
jgi:hypothetical protein